MQVFCEQSRIRQMLAGAQVFVFDISESKHCEKCRKTRQSQKNTTKAAIYKQKSQQPFAKRRLLSNTHTYIQMSRFLKNS